MPRVPGTCQECGADFHRVNKLRKYCTSCQIIRDCNYMPGLKRDCDLCGQTFYPVRHSYLRCNRCRETFDRPDKYPACVGCGLHNRPAPDLTQWCMTCVQESSKRRRQYVATITRVRDARRLEWIAAGRPQHEAPPARREHEQVELLS